MVRKVLWQVIKERKIDKGSVERIKDIFEETKMRVRIGKREKDKFEYRSI